MNSISFNFYSIRNHLEIIIYQKLQNIIILLKFLKNIKVIENK